jgi:hypothetical protein
METAPFVVPDLGTEPPGFLAWCRITYGSVWL